MSLDPALIAIPMVIGIPAAVVMTKMWFTHRERMAGLSAPKQRQAGAEYLESRLAATEQALEAVTAELERVSEQQRFVTKLLADRPPQSSPGLPAPAQPPR